MEGVVCFLSAKDVPGENVFASAAHKAFLIFADEKVVIILIGHGTKKILKCGDNFESSTHDLLPTIIAMAPTHLVPTLGTFHFLIRDCLRI